MARPLFAVSDIHGYRDEFHTALRDAGLIGSHGGWTGADARLWVLGDYVDRGPDGIGVIDDLRRLQSEARAAGGEVGCLLGNHELQLLGADTFGRQPLPGAADGLYGAWLRWGGTQRDIDRLDADTRGWLRSLPPVARIDDLLLLHADTTNYLQYGATVHEVCARVRATMRTADAAGWLRLNYALAARLSFRDDPDGSVGPMLAALGGTRIVHGHSPLSDYFGVALDDITGPHRYAGGRVIAVDGGTYLGGRVIVAELSPNKGEPA
ncbi:metallophosphoesterase [Catellatospora methionotrophica]|uniref:metallophosphoesterase n=1 Tax=Catellatospora methionotrophica TaxID=121620 RepID=UPI0033C04CE0